MDLKRLKRKYVGDVLMLTLILAALCGSSGLGVAVAFADNGTPDRPGQEQLLQDVAATRWDLSMAIAVAIGLPCLAAGYAVGRVGAAALGAASERPELLARSLLFVALAEGIAIYGLLVAILLFTKL